MFQIEHRISFFVPGVPAPGGSKSAFVPTGKDGQPFRRPGGSILVNVTEAGGKKTKEWRRAVAWAGKSHWRGQPHLACALKVHMEFYMPRPKAHYGSGKNASILRLDAPKYHTHAPDALKLARSSEDALTGILWLDDSQTVSLTTEKHFETDNRHEGYEGMMGAWIDIYQVLPAKPEPSEQIQELPLCPPPISTPTPTTATTETSLGFNATKPGDAPW